MVAQDCTVRAFMALTGLPYADADRVMRSVGYRPHDGLAVDDEKMMLAALGVNGYGVRRVSHRVEDLPRYTKEGTRQYLVIGWTKQSAHAWAVKNGEAIDPYRPPFEYRAWEVLG